MEKVFFRSADSRLTLRDKSQIKSFIESIFKKEKRPLSSLTYIFCSDEFLLQMNRDFLKHDYYTDVITFDLSSKGEPTTAEVYISVDRVKDNAFNLETRFRDEMLRVIFHGALHLCGYKDKRKSEITIMREKEEQYLRLFDKNK